MVFSSLSFLFFFLPATLIGYFVFRQLKWRNLALFGASIFFYAWGEPRYVFLILLSVAGNWAVAMGMERYPYRRKALLILGVGLNLLSLGVFKYAGFIVQSLNFVLPVAWPVPRLDLPIGISFYTFQAISYLADVYLRNVRPERNPIFFGTYLSMFPQLIAGPIVRYKTIQGELTNRRETLDDFSAGIRRFIVGLGKKVLLANTMGLIADTILATHPGVGAIPAWYAFVAYTFQIYFDFSGYSDMAIGLGRMLGFHYLENFNYPYVATSITDFWRRWHISLSTFFRDYVYIPLGGNRVKRRRWVLNIAIAWSLTGLWHGASWNFVIWGVYFGLLLMGEKLLWGSLLRRAPRPARHIYTLGLVMISWVIFRVEDFSVTVEWIGALFGAYGAGSPVTLNALNVLHLYPWFIVAAIGSTPLAAKAAVAIRQRESRAWVLDFCLIALMLWSVASLVVSGYNPFIYFRF